MASPKYPIAIRATEAPVRTKPSNYPEPFASRMAGRQKHLRGSRREAQLQAVSVCGVTMVRQKPSAAGCIVAS